MASYGKLSVLEIMIRNMSKNYSEVIGLDSCKLTLVPCLL